MKTYFNQLQRRRNESSDVVVVSIHDIDRLVYTSQWDQTR